MKQNKRKLIVMLIVSVCLLCMTGCGNFIKYYLREDPDKAMERYLEEKYDDELTCIEWSIEDTFDFYWNKVGFSGKFESKKYPGKIIGVGASLTKDKMHYKFCDDYQQVIYLDGVQDIMEKTAEKYFEGEYYVVTQRAGKSDDETVEAMSAEEYTRRWLRYRVCIFVADMNDEKAYAAMEKFVADVEEQGYQFSCFLGRNIKYEKERFLEIMKEEDFNPWAYQGIEWLYDKSLSLTEEGQEEE